MATVLAGQSMPVIHVGRSILIGPQQVPAIVSNEIPAPEDAFGKHYFVVCKSGRGIRARDGRRLGEPVLMTVRWDGSAWTIKEAGFRVGETMPWLQPYVQQLEDMEQAAVEDSLPLDEEMDEQINTPALDRHWAIGQVQSHWM
jgi:hypothetical protein